MYNGIGSSEILQVIPEEGIYIAMRTLIAKGDRVIVMNPCYQSLEEVAVSQGAKVIHWNAVYDDGWKFDRITSYNVCYTKLLRFY